MFIYFFPSVVPFLLSLISHLLPVWHGIVQKKSIITVVKIRDVLRKHLKMFRTVRLASKTLLFVEVGS